jgi:chromosome segregation ATPase
MVGAVREKSMDPDEVDRLIERRAKDKSPKDAANEREAIWKASEAERVEAREAECQKLAERLDRERSRLESIDEVRASVKEEMQSARAERDKAAARHRRLAGRYSSLGGSRKLADGSVCRAKRELVLLLEGDGEDYYL